MFAILIILSFILNVIFLFLLVVACKSNKQLQKENDALHDLYDELSSSYEGLYNVN